MPAQIVGLEAVGRYGIVFRVLVESEVNVRAGIPVPSDLGQIRRGDLPVGESVPVDLAEPGMGKDVAGAVLKISVARPTIAVDGECLPVDGECRLPW